MYSKILSISTFYYNYVKLIIFSSKTLTIFFVKRYRTENCFGMLFTTAFVMQKKPPKQIN